jgi:hypothetical protein
MEAAEEMDTALMVHGHAFEGIPGLIACTIICRGDKGGGHVIVGPLVLHGCLSLSGFFSGGDGFVGNPFQCWGSLPC